LNVLRFLARWTKRLAIVGVLLALVAAAPIVWIETSCQSPRDAAKSGGFTPVITEAPWKRAQNASYLSYPEWYIVHAYEDLAGVMSARDESDFRYGASIGGFWTSLCTLTRVATRHGPVSSDWRGTLYVIGVSFSAEMAVKGAYESTLGKLTAWIRGERKTPEDQFALALARDYAKFLQQTPWYEYPFLAALGRFWSETSWSEGNWIRKIERRLALSLEWGVKSGYAVLIGKLAGLSPADLRIRSVVSGLDANDARAEPRIAVVQALGDGRTLVETPRYREFTTIVHGLLDRGRVVEEIAGNDQALVTVQVLEGTSLALPDANVVFSNPIQSRRSWRRVGLDVKLPALGAILAELAKSSAEFEHLYDY
jgi:hypothetical protein